MNIKKYGDLGESVLETELTGARRGVRGEEGKREVGRGC